MADFDLPLREQDLDASPFVQFERWFKDAASAGVRAPEAAAIATADGDGAPSVRMVLVKEVGESGAVFYSNYESRKGRELTANPRAALLFYWDPIGRQVRIEGPVKRLDPADSERYIRTRPRASRLSAMASPQSEVIADREVLERHVAELTARYEGAELPLGDNWGGYRLTPTVFEFWQHREDRLHDRLRYSRQGGAWTVQRLAP